jgi:molybdopterin synthase sulfur carrier subunit
MPRVVFTSNLRRHLDAPPADAAGSTVRGVLESVFAGNPRLRGYVLDDQGSLRRHVVVFVDGQRAALESPVKGTSEIHVLQALSGG